MGALQIIFDGEVASRVFDHLNISSISSTSSSERASASQQDLQNNNFLLQTFSKKNQSQRKWGSQNLHKINEYIQVILQPCVQRHPDIQLGVGSNVLSFHLNGICLPI